ncbi:MAG: MG2 domain-containing protein, partial [Acidobacteriota bacterium]
MITLHLDDRRQQQLSLVLALVAAIGLTTASCSTRHEAPPEIVAAHSTGALSAGDTIRVRFDRDMVSSETLGAEVSPSPITLRPKVEGVARWTAPDVLSFEPTTFLEPGTRYEARLDIGAITAEDMDAYHFEVEVMEQTLEIMIEGLRTTAEGPEHLELEGILRTADVTVSDTVEQCLEATLEGRSLRIQWTHTDGGRVHRFTVGAITRIKTDQTIALEWNGASIGAEMHGSRQIEVVRKGVFRVIGARTVEHPHPSIEVRCSEPVDPEQELLGLIRVSDHEDLRTDIRANIVTISATAGWDDEETLRIETGLRSIDGQRLASPFEQTLSFQPPLPSVRFPGQGVIVPTANGLSLPIETTALTAIEIEATQVFEDNMAQFFQVNTLAESDELRRVGRVIWEDRLILGPNASGGENRRWALDLSPLVSQYPGGLYRIKIRFNRGDIDFACSDAFAFPTPAALASSTPSEASNWDQWEDPSDYSWSELYEHRNNPCHPGFYNSFYDHDIEIERNILLSNLGLVAKQTGGGETIVLATDLRTAKPLADAEVTLLDYQQQVLATGLTGADGMLRLSTTEEAFLLIAHSSDQVGYLRLDDGQSLSLSRFDTGGVTVRQGLKGFLYGERGVWRPGDQMHIGFILHDPESSIPADHPIVFELRNPLDQLVTREVQTVSGQQFFVFEPTTDEAAATGNYVVTVRLGDAVFEKTLKVAMIRPNRLRIALETDQPELRAPEPRLQGLLEATWLHGAEAENLETRIEAVLRPTSTTFTSKPDFIFDDPTRTLDSEPMTLFEGVLDAHGRLRLDEALPLDDSAPGKVRAILTTRVFEPGGAFSITESSVDVSPFERYVGLRTPPGDTSRGMLLTDTEHRIDLALLNQEGRPVEGDVTVNLYKISWRWWWEKGGDEGLADFAQSTSLEPVATGKVALSHGEGSWQFSVAYPEWGRFLLLAEDAESGHRTGKVLYIDWPGWAGKARKGAGDSAQVLALSADTDRATVGDEVTVTIPSAAGGTILVSIEKGDTVVHTEVIEALAERTPYRFLVTEAMTPNIYVGATFIQPHDHPENDLPIRMYGVLPLSIHQPDSRLEPKIEVPPAFKPESTGSITVSEAQGRPMSYTVAVVDEGLLGLTGFATPDPWSEMYRKEALGVRTWDLYDDVIGAWGSALEALLAIGGGDEGRVKSGSRKERRFPPMVRFMGPFRLEAGETATHDLDIPLYLGSVRVMVIAAAGNAFGRAGRDVPVRKKVMVLGSMPRQLAPGETLLWPISVWAMNDTATTVQLTTEIDGPASVEGPSTRTLSFSGPGEELVILPLKIADTEGPAKFTVTAEGGGETSRHTTNID